MQNKACARSNNPYILSTMTRKYTNQLLENIENGLLDKDQVIMAFCSYCSESDIYDMMRSNEMLEGEEEEEEEEGDSQD
jgi:hypothetical protein